MSCRSRTKKGLHLFILLPISSTFCTGFFGEANLDTKLNKAAEVKRREVMVCVRTYIYPLEQTKEDKGKRKCCLFLVTGGKWREASSRDGEVESEQKRPFFPFDTFFFAIQPPCRKMGLVFPLYSSPASLMRSSSSAYVFFHFHGC